MADDGNAECDVAEPGGQGDQHGRRRASPLTLQKLLDSLLVGRLLRSQDSLSEVLVRSVGAIYGAGEAEQTRAMIEAKEIQVPAPTQLSHARLKLDLLLMNLRREDWRLSDDVWVMLSADSSPQGLDFLVTVEDRIKNPGLVVDASPKELAQYSLSCNLQTSTLPPLVVGSGNSDTASKFELLMRSIMLDVGPEALARYGESVVGFCSDFGVESHVTQASE